MKRTSPGFGCKADDTTKSKGVYYKLVGERVEEDDE